MRYENVSAEFGYSEVTTQSTLYKDTRSNLSMSCPLTGLSISMEEKPSSISWSGTAPGRSLILTGTSWGSPGKASGLKSGIARGACTAGSDHPCHQSQAGQATAVVQQQTLLQEFRQGNTAVWGLLYLICYCHTRQVREKIPKINKDAWHVPQLGSVLCCLKIFQL